MKFKKHMETFLQIMKEKAQTKLSESNNSRAELYNRLAVYRPEYDKVVSWYERVTGLSEVRVAQDRVLESQKQFMNAQDRRRDVSVELRTIQNKLKDIRNELLNTSRSEDRYIELVTQEHNLLKQENSIIDRVNYSEKEERDSFILLSTTLKDSHDRERIQAERTKYVSIVGSILGTIIGIIGSTLINAWKMNEFKRMVLDAKLDSSNSNKSDQIKHLLLQVQKQNKMLKNAQFKLNSDKPTSIVEPDWKYTDRDVIILTTINCTIVALSAYLVSKLF
ncbi:coiled-coil domain-containing protein 51-like [Myzus persicae]|uniref:coiled-coil domain-containing protein 51-like n=1 Tax=Myzus persicae TaxID=13164 RepID=UPI000B935D2D|nr:coiled-coil domain-containing protein 51-like [Myzus persicae]XP_022174469.1 coiled-coil domain-containing protein 51-like [Myzus persicae]XP_022174470.1 coiled-coil domain-containing protein 51-like [Myzus persicae]